MMAVAPTDSEIARLGLKPGEVKRFEIMGQ